jgi:hypothetical protein
MKYLVSLEISSKRHDLSTIGTAIGLKPGVGSRNKGDKNYAGKTWGETTFRIESGIDKDRPLREHIAALVDQLPHDFRAKLDSKILDACTSFRVGAIFTTFTCTTVISRDQLEQLANLRCSVEISAYPGDGR